MVYPTTGLPGKAIGPAFSDQWCPQQRHVPAHAAGLLRSQQPRTGRYGNRLSGRFDSPGSTIRLNSTTREGSYGFNCFLTAGNYNPMSPSDRLSSAKIFRIFQSLTVLSTPLRKRTKRTRGHA
jgi:hypothetical protein